MCAHRFSSQKSPPELGLVLANRVNSVDKVNYTLHGRFALWHKPVDWHFYAPRLLEGA